MTAGARDDDRDEADDRPGGWRRPILIVLATAPVIGIVAIIGMMLKTEAAFDESRCPYHEGRVVEVRPGVTVREDARECEPGVQEHRWVLARDGEEPVVIGARRMQSHYFEGTYTWSAREEEDGRVRLEIQNPGQEPRVFRERGDDAGP